MVGNIEPEIQFIAGADIIFQVLLEIKVPDKTNDPDVVVAGGDADIITVFAVDERGVGEQLAVEDMVPAQRARRIAIGEIETVTDAQVILAEITGEIEMIFIPQFVIGLGVEVVEI
jgi:hypothetical protein